MAIDSSIYFQQQTPDLVGSYEKGLTIRQMLDERKKQQGIKDAYKAGLVTAPDTYKTEADGTVTNVPGATTFNPKLTLNALVGIDPKEYETLKSKTDAQALQEQQLKKQQIAEQSQFLSNVQDQLKNAKTPQIKQAIYSAALKEAQSRNYDTRGYPSVYGDDAQQLIDLHAGEALDANQRATHEEKKNEIAATAARDAETKANNLRVNQRELAKQKQEWDAMLAKAGIARQDMNSQFAHEEKMQGIKGDQQTALQTQKGDQRTAQQAAMAEAFKNKNDSKLDEKDAKDLDEHLSKGWTARSGAAGLVQQKLNAADYADQLYQQAKGQPHGMDSRQMEEYATAVQRLIGAGGQSARSAVEALVPHTWWGGKQTFQEWLTNKPTGLDMQAFADRMNETIQRERATAGTQMKQFQIEGLPRFSNFAKRNPDLYQRMLAAKQITPDMIDENGRYKIPATTDKSQMAGQIIIMSDGRRFKVGADGDTLEEIKTQTAGK